MYGTSTLNIAKRLDFIRTELAELNAALVVSSKQLSFLGEVADDANTEMVVSQAPLEKRLFDEASGDLERHRRYHEGLIRKIEALKKEQDDLLDQLLEQESG